MGFREEKHERKMKPLSYMEPNHPSTPLTAACPEGWPSVFRSSLRLGPEGSAPILNWLHCCITSEPSRGEIMEKNGAIKNFRRHKTNPGIDTYHALWYRAGTWSCVGGHGVCLRWRTWELCLPKLRWTLQHSSQINTPLFTEAQRGSKRKTK